MQATVFLERCSFLVSRLRTRPDEIGGITLLPSGPDLGPLPSAFRRMKRA